MRIGWVDVAKGIGILLVCVGHTRLGESGLIASWITSFHMPLFFFLAGLCFDENRYAKLGDYLKRKGVALLYPYFMLTVFVALAFAIFGFRPFGEVFKSMFIDVFPGCNVIGFWFLRALILAELTYAVLAKFVPEKWRLPLFAAGAVVGYACPHFFCYDLLRLNAVLIALLFYEIGHLLRHRIQYQATLRDLGIATGLLVFHVCLLWLSGFPMTQMGAASSNTFPVLALILSLVGILVIALFSIFLSPPPHTHTITHSPIRWIATSLSWLGRYSILLLAVHPTCGQLRLEWVSHFASLPKGISVVLELVLIVFLMWALSGPLKFFMKMPKIRQRSE